MNLKGCAILNVIAPKLSQFVQLSTFCNGRGRGLTQFVIHTVIINDICVCVSMNALRPDGQASRCKVFVLWHWTFLLRSCRSFLACCVHHMIMLMYGKDLGLLMQMVKRRYPVAVLGVVFYQVRIFYHGIALVFLGHTRIQPIAEHRLTYPVTRSQQGILVRIHISTFQSIANL